MSFGDVIRSASSPSGHPSGIGGNSDTLWGCGASHENIVKLSIIDLSILQNVPAPRVDPSDW